MRWCRSSRRRAIEAIVVLITKWLPGRGDYNECPGNFPDDRRLVRKFDRAVDVVISGHTHQPNVCAIDGRLVTSGDKYGPIVTTIDLKLDPATRDVVSTRG